MPNQRRINQGKGVSRLAVATLIAIASLLLIDHGTATAQLSVLHDFSSSEYYLNGFEPEGRLVMDGKTGTLFGVTSEGGDEVCDGDPEDPGYFGCGGVFALGNNPKGVPTVFGRIHDFTATGHDGNAPYTALERDARGNLYGTAPYGGNYACAGDYGCGAVFEEIAPTDGGAWTEKLLHLFAGGKDGAYPGSALLLGPAGVLYGTTCAGGPAFSGTAFSLTPKGGSYLYAVIHAFDGGPNGGCPEGQFAIDKSGNLYGTAALGGKRGFGVVFELKPGKAGWTETVLHSFAGEPHDGESPESGLVFDSSGNLFGATPYGGANGDGMVYELSLVGTTWTETVLHNFNGSDGESPSGDKLAIDRIGDLFGTTEDGGTHGDGTIFELTNSAGSYTFASLYSFCVLANCADGAYPYGGVIIDATGNLYGTTAAGGTANAGTAYIFKQQDH